MKTCPKCGYTRQLSDSPKPGWACPACGLVYAKYDPAPPKFAPIPKTPLPEDPVAPAALQWGRWLEYGLIGAAIIWVAVTYMGVIPPRTHLTITLAFPWFGLALVLAWPHLFTFRVRMKYNKDELRLASVAPPLFVSALVLAIGANAIWQLHDALPAIIAGFAGGLAMTALFVFLSRPLRRHWVSIAAIALMAMFYAGGAAIYLNGILDVSAPKTYSMRVLGKHEGQRGRGSTAYYLTTTAPSRAGSTQYKVNARLYEALNRDDYLCMIQYPGAFGWSWYRLRACQGQEREVHAANRVEALKKFGMDYAMQVYELNNMTVGRAGLMKLVDEALADVEGGETRDDIRKRVHSAYEKEGFTLKPQVGE